MPERVGSSGRMVRASASGARGQAGGARWDANGLAESESGAALAIYRGLQLCAEGQTRGAAGLLSPSAARPPHAQLEAQLSCSARSALAGQGCSAAQRAKSKPRLAPWRPLPVPGAPVAIRAPWAVGGRSWGDLAARSSVVRCAAGLRRCIMSLCPSSAPRRQHHNPPREPSHCTRTTVLCFAASPIRHG